jgi:hypothetical protein
MPTTRRRIGHRMAFQLTPQALEAWMAGDYHACNTALGLLPCDFSPFDVTRETPPEWLVAARGTDLVAGPNNWRRAWELRRALVSEVGPPGRYDRHGRPLGAAR